MNLRKVTFIGLALIVLQFTGCIQYKYNYSIPVSVQQPSLQLPVQIDSLIIIDSRDTISTEKDITFPLVFSKGYYQKKRFYPRLNAEHKNIIGKTVRSNIHKKTDQLQSGIYTVNVMEAWKEYKVISNGHRESVFYKIQITLQLEEKIYGVNVEQGFNYESPKATTDHFELLYKEGLKSLTRLALSGLKINYYSDKDLNSDCFSKEYEQNHSFDNGVEVTISGKMPLKSVLIDVPLFEINEAWNFKVSTNTKGQIIDIQLLDEGKQRAKVMRMTNYIRSMVFYENETNENEINCRAIKITKK
ncbi:MAG: hypothetical protein Sapg2KO_51550 [Saprospiraceae bacterium]